MPSLSGRHRDPCRGQDDLLDSRAGRVVAFDSRSATGPLRRTSPRQAIAVAFDGGGPVWSEPLRLPVLLDILGTLIAINGVTLAVSFRSSQDAHVLSDELPAGIETVVRVIEQDREQEWIAPAMYKRGFDRVLVVAGDTIGVPLRPVN